MQSPAQRAALCFPDRLVSHFEGLGDRCDIGIMQNLCGASVLGLLRFAAIPFEHLLDGIASRFVLLDDPSQLQVFTRSGEVEWMGSVPALGIEYHTGTTRTDMREADVLARERRRIPFLRRKFAGILDDPYKIFVRQEDGRNPVEMRALHAGLKVHAPHRLFWISLAAFPDQIGSVEEVGPGLLRGYYGPDWQNTLLTPRGLAVWLHLFSTAISVLRPDYQGVLEGNQQAQHRLDPVAATDHWMCLAGSTTNEPGSAPPDAAGMTIRHELAQLSEGPPDTFMSCETSALRPGMLYVASAWVWLLEDFAGWIAMAFSDLAPINMWPADTNKRGRWQRIVTTLRAPFPQQTVRVGLLAAGPTGSGFLSTAWRVESGVVPIDCLDGLPGG